MSHKGVVYDSKPTHFLSNSENISSLSASFASRSVCAEKKVQCSYTALVLYTGNKQSVSGRATNPGRQIPML